TGPPAISTGRHGGGDARRHAPTTGWTHEIPAVGAGPRGRAPAARLPSGGCALPGADSGFRVALCRTGPWGGTPRSHGHGLAPAGFSADSAGDGTPAAEDRPLPDGARRIRGRPGTTS